MGMIRVGFWARIAHRLDGEFLHGHNLDIQVEITGAGARVDSAEQAGAEILSRGLLRRQGDPSPVKIVPLDGSTVLYEHDLMATALRKVQDVVEDLPVRLYRTVEQPTMEFLARTLAWQFQAAITAIGDPGRVVAVTVGDTHRTGSRVEFDAVAGAPEVALPMPGRDNAEEESDV